MCLTLGLIGAGGLCLLGRQPGAPLEEEAPSPLLLKGYGPNPRALADELLGYLGAWEARGRPGTRGLRVRVYDPADPEAPAAPGAVSVRKRWTRLVVDWQDRAA
jgi:hypothetical protein